MTLSQVKRGSPRAYGARAAMRNLLAALAFLAALAGAAAADVRILAFGDSLTQGYGLPEAQGFVPRLQAWLDEHGASDVTVTNAGVSGDTTAGGLARIDRALDTGDIDAVIVALGGNDMLRGLDLGEMRSNLDGILGAIVARDLPVLLAGLPAPTNYGEDYRQEFDAVFRDLAEAHGAILYPSFLAGMGEGRSMREVMVLMQPDGIHPNAEGVAAIVDHIGPRVLDLVAAARAAGA